MGLLHLLRPRRCTDASQAYIDTIIDTYGASEVWPLVDIASGTTITAKVSSARNGTLTGWTLQNAAGPISGTLAPFADGINDYGDIYTANLATLFDGDLGAVGIWAKVYDASVLTDSTRRNAIGLGANLATDFLWLGKTTTNNQVQGYFEGNNTPQNRTATMSSTAWKFYFMTWNVLSNRMRFFVDGVKQGVDVSGIDTLSGLGVAGTMIGASAASSFLWHGWLAYAMFWGGSEPSEADALAIYNAAS